MTHLELDSDNSQSSLACNGVLHISTTTIGKHYKNSNRAGGDLPASTLLFKTITYLASDFCYVHGEIQYNSPTTFFGEA